jgi:hypothetical protein
MEEANIFGPHVPKPSGAVVFRPVWSYTVKHDDHKKARMCGDGSVLHQKGLMYAQQCNAACIYQTYMKIFFAYLVIKGCVAIRGDAVNVYVQMSIPKEVEQFVVVDHKMKDWWKDKHVTDISVSIACYILKALQGHPHAGQWCADKIEKHRVDLYFKPLHHEPSLYLRRYEDAPVLVCWQSNELMFGGEHEPILRRICTVLDKAVNFVYESGFVKHYNGMEVVQTRDYVHIHVGLYIHNILYGHGWNMPGNEESRMV